jgi:hypothetical protein
MYFCTIFSILVLYLNFVASYHVLNVDSLEKDQRIYQLLIVWLIPMLGSVIIASFHLSDKDYVRDQKKIKTPGSAIINLFVFITFAKVGSSGYISGANDDGGIDTGGYDSAGDGGGGGE